MDADNPRFHGMLEMIEAPEYVTPPPGMVFVEGYMLRTKAKALQAMLASI